MTEAEAQLRSTFAKYILYVRFREGIDFIESKASGYNAMPVGERLTEEENQLLHEIAAEADAMEKAGE